MKNRSILFLLLLGATTLFAQKTNYNPAQTYPIEALKEDLATLKQQLETVHTGLYTYTTKTEMDQYFQELENSITAPMTGLDFFRLIFPLNTKIKNGHTRILPPGPYLDAMNATFKLFPFEVYWDNNQLYLLENLSTNNDISVGSIIETINGEKATTIYQEISSQLWRDGDNTSAPMTAAYNGFSSFYAFLKGLPAVFELTLTLADGTTSTVSVAARTKAALVATKKERYKNRVLPWEDHKNGLNLTIKEGIATMTVRGFDSNYAKQQGKKNFKRFYKKAFEQIIDANIEHLIIDLRNNGGGDPMPTIELFAHLHPEPFTFYKAVTSNVQRVPDKKLYNASFFERLVYPLAFKKQGDTYVPNWIARLAGLKGLKPSKPNTPYYAGKVYVLTNANSFSATGEMTAIIKAHNRATFIGEEPGGNPNLNTSGFQFVLDLPNTKNIIVMPFWSWEMNVDFENTGRGVVPDHPVRPSIEDMLTGKDVVMEYTVDLISKY